MSKRKNVGTFSDKINSLLGIHLKSKYIYLSKGLKTHMMKSRHYKAVKYIDRIPEIILKPDYIGLTGTPDNPGIEYIKCFDCNIQLVVKIDEKNDSLYIATMFDIPQKKIARLLHSGKIVKYID